MVKSDAGSADMPADIKKMSFEDALAELEEIVSSLEGGQVNLKDSIDKYKRGSMLKRRCDQMLGEARTQVQKIVVDEGGEVKAEPADLD